MQRENEDFLNDGAQQFLSALFPLLTEVANYSELITLPEFWKHFATLKEKHLQEKIIEQISKFYKCSHCGYRLRRAGEASWVCYGCSDSHNFHDDFVKFPRFDCLKCFKLYNIDSFTSSECRHLCGYCTAKELKKLRRGCRICTKEFDNPTAGATCVHCIESKLFGDLNELRCGCKYCNNCFLTLKKTKRCLKCYGINVLTSELYDFSKKSSEVCFICGQDKVILSEKDGEQGKEFENNECCYLDICRACKKQSGYCIGCEQTAK